MRAYTMIRIHIFNRYIFTVLVIIWNFFRPLSSSYVLKTLSLSAPIHLLILICTRRPKITEKKKIPKKFRPIKKSRIVSSRLHYSIHIYFVETMRHRESNNVISLSISGFNSYHWWRALLVMALNFTSIFGFIIV